LNRPHMRAVRGAVYVVLPLVFPSSAAVRGFQRFGVGSIDFFSREDLSEMVVVALSVSCIGNCSPMGLSSSPFFIPLLLRLIFIFSPCSVTTAGLNNFRIPSNKASSSIKIPDFLRISLRIVDSVSSWKSAFIMDTGFKDKHLSQYDSNSFFFTASYERW